MDESVEMLGRGTMEMVLRLSTDGPPYPGKKGVAVLEPGPGVRPDRRRLFVIV